MDTIQPQTQPRAQVEVVDVRFAADNDISYKSCEEGEWEQLYVLDELPVFGEAREGDRECYPILKRVTQLLLSKRFTLYGDAGCLNHTGLIEPGPLVECVHGVPMMFEKSQVIRGEVVGADPKYIHMTRVNATASSTEVTLKADVLYLIHGPDQVEEETQRYYTMSTCLEVDGYIDMRGLLLPQGHVMYIRNGKLCDICKPTPRIPTQTLDATSRDGYFALSRRYRPTIPGDFRVVPKWACKAVRDAVRRRSGTISVRAITKVVNTDERNPWVVDDQLVARLLLTDVRLRRKLAALDAACLNLPEFHAVSPRRLALCGPVRLCDETLELVQGRVGERSAVFDSRVIAKKAGNVYCPVVVDNTSEELKAPDGSWWI